MMEPTHQRNFRALAVLAAFVAACWLGHRWVEIEPDYISRSTQPHRVTRPAPTPPAPETVVSTTPQSTVAIDKPRVELTLRPYSAGSDSSQPDIEISEVYYNPPGPIENSEFIEIVNVGSASRRIDGWRFTNGIDFTFPSGTTVGPGACLVICRGLKDFNLHLVNQSI